MVVFGLEFDMEKAQKRKKKRSYIKQITTLVLLGIVVFVCLFNLILRDKSVSKPKMTIKNVLNGEYMEEYETYSSERFAGKDLSRSLNHSIQTLLGKRQSDGVYKGKDGFLAEEIAAMDEESVDKSIQAIKEFDNTYYNIPVYFMLVPNAANVQSDRLPASAVIRNQKEQFQKIKENLGEEIHWVEVQDTFTDHKKEELYYHTDEHWTSLGAYYGYEALAQTMALDTSKAPEMKTYVVNNDFSGSLAKKSGYERGSEESISVYMPKKQKNAVKTVVSYDNSKKKTATLYDVSKLEKKDKYNLFLGGDHGIVNIKTTAETTDRLLILKDSYANCLIPFLTPYYREIVVIDPAHYSGNLQEVMQNTKFASILFLYNGNSFVTDTSIHKVLETSVAPETDTESAEPSAEAENKDEAASSESDAENKTNETGETDGTKPQEEDADETE